MCWYGIHLLHGKKKLATWCLWNEYFARSMSPRMQLKYWNPSSVSWTYTVDEPNEGKNNGDRDTPNHTREEEDVLDDGEAALDGRMVVSVGMVNRVGVPPKLLQGLMVRDVLDHDEAQEESED